VLERQVINKKKELPFKPVKFIILLTGSVVLLASYIILLYTFFTAYLNPNKIVHVHINNIGEANIEFFFLLLTIPCIIYYLRCFCWNSKNKEIWFSSTRMKKIREVIR